MFNYNSTMTFRFLIFFLFILEQFCLFSYSSGIYFFFIFFLIFYLFFSNFSTLLNEFLLAIKSTVSLLPVVSYTLFYLKIINFFFLKIYILFLWLSTFLIYSNCFLFDVYNNNHLLNRIVLDNIFKFSSLN
jgi:hypothetical protein